MTLRLKQLQLRGPEGRVRTGWLGMAGEYRVDPTGWVGRVERVRWLERLDTVAWIVQGWNGMAWANGLGR